jgi:hypothetical protein
MERVVQGRIADVTVTSSAGTLELGATAEVGGNATAGSGTQTDRAATAVAARGLARAAGGSDGREYLVRPAAVPGVVLGLVKGGTPRDTSVVPTHDLSVCKPFTESAVPSRVGGVGNALVWLEGVTEGPKDEAPRRVTLTLDGCRIAPRVLRIAAGGTVLVHSRDAMMSRLQFVGVADGANRATMLLSDAGQIVPSSDVTAPAGLVEVRDDRHPWVRAWLAMAPHPFLAVTEADGAFRFDGVTPGRYTLVVWHERMGTRRTTVRVDAGVQTRVEIPM